MRSFATLMWEQWRQTWRGLALISGALFGYWAVLSLVRQLVFLVFSNNASIALAAAFVPVAGAIGLLFMQESRSQIDFAYPRRMFWLPVHTYSLVAAQFLFKLIVLAVLAVAAGWICQTEIKPTFVILPQVFFFTGLAAALLGLVFLTCGYGGGTGIAIFIPAAAVSLIGFQPIYAAVYENFTIVMPPSALDLSRMGLSPEAGQELWVYPEIPAWAWWAGAGALAWWAIISYLGARHARSEVPGDRIGRWVRMMTNVAYLDREGGKFATPEAAHRWFEWRRVVYLYPWITLILGLLMVASLRGSVEEEENKFIVAFSLLAVAPAIVAVLIGYSMTRPDPRYMWFVGGRPLTTATISRTRILVSIRAIATAYVLAFIAYAVASFVLFGNANPINALITDLQLITSTYGDRASGLIELAGAIWIAFAVVWSLFWLGRSAGVVAWVSGLLSAAYFYLTGSRVYDVVDSHVVSPIWIVFGGTLTVLLLCGFIAAYVIAVRRGLLSLKLLPILAAILGLTCGALYLFREVIGPEPPIAAISVWVLIPLLPFASVPATLAWQRHR